MCHLLTGITGEIMRGLCLGLLDSNLGAVMCHNGFLERQITHPDMVITDANQLPFKELIYFVFYF